MNLLKKYYKGLSIIFLSLLFMINSSLVFADNAEGKLDLKEVEKISKNVSNLPFYFKKTFYIGIATLSVIRLMVLVVAWIGADDEHDKNMQKKHIKSLFIILILAIVIFELIVAMLNWVLGVSIKW